MKLNYTILSVKYLFCITQISLPLLAATKDFKVGNKEEKLDL